MNDNYEPIVRALVIPTDAEPYTIMVPQSAGDTIRDIVGGWFDCVRGDDFHGYVNDTGLIDGLPINPIATALFGRILAGNAIVFGSLDARGEYDGYEHHLNPMTAMVARRLWAALFIHLENARKEVPS